MAKTEKQENAQSIIERGYFEFNGVQFTGVYHSDYTEAKVDVKIHYDPDTTRAIIYRDYTSGDPDPAKNGIPQYTVLFSETETERGEYNISATSYLYLYDGTIIGEKWHLQSVGNDASAFQVGGTLPINHVPVQWSSFRVTTGPNIYPLSGEYDQRLPESPEAVVISDGYPQFLAYASATNDAQSFDSDPVTYLLKPWLLHNCLVSEDKEGIYNYLHGGDLPDDTEVIDPTGEQADEDDGDDGDESQKIGTTTDNNPYITPQDIRGASNYYALNQGNVESFINWLWFDMLDLEELILNKATKIYNNIADNIESIRLFPLDVADPNGGNSNIILGRAAANLSVPTVKKDFKFKHSEFTLKGRYANPNQFYGYEPYSNCWIYLPFVGFRELPLDVWGAKSTVDSETLKVSLSYPTIQVWYGVDFRTGIGVCQLKLKSKDGTALIEEYDCTIGIDIPYSAETGFNIVSDIMNTFTEALPQAKMMKSIISGKTDGILDIGNVETSYTKSNGTRNASAYIFNPFHCYIINTHSVVDLGDKNLKAFNHAYGRSCMNSYKLKNLNGFTICENVDIHFGNTTVDGVKVAPTQNEWEELKNLMESGVYL